MAEPIRNIRFVVMGVLSRMKHYGFGTKDYPWLLEIAVSHYQSKLKGFSMPSLVSERVNVDYATRIWNYPSDYMRYTKIAYHHGGRLLTLGVDNTLDLSEKPALCEQPIEDLDIQPLPEQGYYFWDYPFSGPGITPYAQGGGFSRNYYRDYPDKRYIQFSHQLPAGLAVVEYLSMGKNVNDNTLVLATFEDAFRRYLVWQVCELSGKPTLLKMAKDMERQYKDAMWDSKILQNAPTSYEVMKAIYQSCGFNLR